MSFWLTWHREVHVLLNLCIASNIRTSPIISQSSNCHVLSCPVPGGTLPTLVTLLWHSINHNQ